MANDFKEIKKKLDVLGIIGSRVEIRQQGNAYVACCPFHNESTPSFNLSDKGKDGWLWHCFGCGKGGDVVTFVELFDRCDTATAIEKLSANFQNKEFRDDAEEINHVFRPVGENLKKPKQTITLEKYQEKIDALWKNERALDWLRKERLLDDETIQRMKLGYTQKHIYRIKEGMEHLRDKGWVIFPRFADSKVVAIKYRSVGEGKENKAFSQVNNMDSRALFNVDAITPLAPIYLTEGELDTCIFEMCGFTAVSAPSANADITTEGRIQLKLAERVFLAGDNDGSVGNEYMGKLLRELKENTHILVWPDGIKDANDFFRITCEGDKEKFRAAIEQMSGKAKRTPPEGFLNVIDSLRSTDTVDLENDPNRLHFPPNMKWADKICFTPRGGVMILYSTYTGTGKSMLKTQILLNEARRGEIVADLSPEIRDQEYLALLTSQTVGPTIPGGLKRTGRMDKKHFLTAADMLDKPTMRGTDFRYYVGHNVLGSNEDEVINFLETTIRSLGVTRFAIDTFHKLIQAEGKLQTSAEGSLAKRIEKLGIQYGTIFMLINQSNAEAENLDNLKKNEHGTLRGSREVRDAACSIYLLHRNRRSQKDGENPDDILEKEAGLFAKKMRFSGPGYPQVRLLLQGENSLFVEGLAGGDPGPQEPAPPSDDSYQEHANQF